MGFTLTERFLAPAGWRTGSFVNKDTGHRIHYGSVSPSDAKAAVVCLGGLSEFAEKYFEVAHDMMDRGYGFWFIDWHYQGHSGRLHQFPQRRHSDGFDTDVSDLHKFVADHVKPANRNIPLIMLGHSMGGNIGMHYLAKYPGIFNAAAFTAPFFGIYNFKWPMRLLATLVSFVLPIVGEKYIAKGKDWHEDMRKGDGSEIFSSDSVRDRLHKHWSQTDPELQVGNVTFGWVIQALRSCAKIKNPDLLKKIDIPVLIGVASKEAIVDNDAIRDVVAHLYRGQMIEIDGACHEILMERDQYRDAFLKAFDKMLEENKIAPTTTEESADMLGFTKNKDRLSDRVLFAIELALEQKDVESAQILNRALEVAMTRNTGGGEFIERRDYPREIEKMIAELRSLKQG